jgi:hypothetical protein
MIENYYVSQRDRLMRDFDRLSKIMEMILASHYGSELGRLILNETRREFDALIPQLPY